MSNPWNKSRSQKGADLESLSTALIRANVKHYHRLYIYSTCSLLFPFFTVLNIVCETWVVSDECLPLVCRIFYNKGPYSNNSTHPIFKIEHIKFWSFCCIRAGLLYFLVYGPADCHFGNIFKKEKKNLQIFLSPPKWKQNRYVLDWSVKSGETWVLE